MFNLLKRLRFSNQAVFVTVWSISLHCSRLYRADSSLAGISQANLNMLGATSTGSFVRSISEEEKILQGVKCNKTYHILQACPTFGSWIGAYPSGAPGRTPPTTGSCPKGPRKPTYRISATPCFPLSPQCYVSRRASRRGAESRLRSAENVYVGLP